MRKLISLPLLFALAACGGGDELAGDTRVPSTVESPAVTLCVSSSCGVKEVLLDIASAENLHFTDDGRLFVSGAENVYEISRDVAGAWHKTPLVEGSGSFGGIAHIGDVLYVNSFDGQIYAGRLTATPQLTAIHSVGTTTNNGLTAGPDGELYFTNGPVPGNSVLDPKIVRLRLDPANPFRVVEQTDWLTTGLLSFPNGIQRRSRTLYFAQSTVTTVSLGEIRTVEVRADGSPGVPQSLGSVLGIIDDIGMNGEQVLIANYTNGQIELMGADGRILQSTNLLSFDNPSSVRRGRPPLFADHDLVVTEKGVIGLPPTPGYGNVLSVFRRR